MGSVKDHLVKKKDFEEKIKTVLRTKAKQSETGLESSAAQLEYVVRLPVYDLTLTTPFKKRKQVQHDERRVGSNH